MSAIFPVAVSLQSYLIAGVAALAVFGTVPSEATASDRAFGTVLALSDIQPLTLDEPAEDEASEEEPALTPEIPPGASAPDPDKAAVLYDLSLLPEPVRRMRQLIVDAAQTGDVEALRPLIGIGPEATRLAIGGVEGDPIDYLRSASGDDAGLEVLAIILDLLEAGFVRVEEGDGEALYIWPYFFAVPLESLTPPQQVELLRIVTAGDLAEMEVLGSYNFYRLAITESGVWSYLVAGH